MAQKSLRRVLTAPTALRQLAQKMVLCKNRSVVSPYFASRKLQYDPLLRVPHRQDLPQYDPKDFSLEDSYFMPDLKNVSPSPRPRRLSQLKDAWKNKRSVTIVYLLLRASVILVLIAQIFNRNFENVFLCVLTLFLFGVPNMVQHRLDIELPNTLEIIILLFIYAAEILGRLTSIAYLPYSDTVLHTLNGFLCAAVGFSLLDILNREEKIGFSLSPLYLAIVAFCFSMTVAVIWEFFECTMDQLFLLDMQKDTVVNTIRRVMLGTPPAVTVPASCAISRM